MEENITKQLYSLEDVAQILNVSTSIVRKWEYAGKVKAVRLGRRVMVSKDTLEKIINEGVN